MSGVRRVRLGRATRGGQIRRGGPARVA